MFIELKTSDGSDTFVLNCFQIVSVHENMSGATDLYSIHDEKFITSEKYKDVIEKLNAVIK